MSAASPARIRLMPVVITAAAALLGLKAIGLATHTSYLFAPPAAAAGASEPKPAAQPKPEEKPPVDAAGALAVDESAQKALEDALGKRREAIDARAAELDMRETTLKAAEQRLDDRLGELKRLEQAIAELDRKRSEQDEAKLKELVTLYESMKPKEAARIFEKLEARVLLDVAGRMKPRTLSLIMAAMAPDNAQKLTVALARRETAQAPAETAAAAQIELPKIEGKPTR